MNVTRENFACTVDEFCELAQSCEFFAFDEEMTGISLPNLPETPLMCVEEMYHSKRQVAQRYSIIQIGICLFHRDDAVAGASDASAIGRRYIARPFNFYLFPSSSQDGPYQGPVLAGAEESTDVVLSSSAIAFLRKNKMDFQRWFYHGIPFCNEAMEEQLRNQASASAAAGVLVTPSSDSPSAADSSSLSSSPSLLSASEQQWVANAKAVAETFARETDFEKCLPLTKSRAARERVKKWIEQSYDTMVVAFRNRPNGAKDAVLVRTTKEETIRRRQLELELKERELLDKIGFRRAFRALVQCKKPCVGHNCFADVLFLLAAVDRPLPSLLPDMKARVQELFPTVFDTRYISGQYAHFPPSRFQSTHLGGLFAAYTTAEPTSCAVEVTLPLGFGAYDSRTLQKAARGSNPAHEAGYDALMTGTVFLNLLAERKLTIEAAAPLFGNRLALFRSLYACDLSTKEKDEYLPQGALIVDHEATVTAAEIESLLIAATHSLLNASSTATAVTASDEEKRGVASPSTTHQNHVTVEELSSGAATSLYAVTANQTVVSFHRTELLRSLRNESFTTLAQTVTLQHGPSKHKIRARVFEPFLRSGEQQQQKREQQQKRDETQNDVPVTSSSVASAAAAAVHPTSAVGGASLATTILQRIGRRALSALLVR